MSVQDWFLDSSGYGLSDPLQISSLSGEIQRQNREIDLFLHFQSERLKYAIQEQKRQQISSMMRSMESKASEMMRKAEHDLAEATSKARELEDCLRRAEMERELWGRVAKDNEAMISGLNNMMVQAQQKFKWASRPNNESQAQDAESVCEIEDDKMGCKWCRKKDSCAVLLPCRHLCACKECGILLEMCPVCGSVKEGVVEVSLS